MTKTRILTLSVVVLIILNVMMAAFLFMGRPGHKKFKGPKDRIVKTLNLNTDQVVAYDELIVQHRKAITRLDSLILDSKTQLYRQTMAQDSAIIEAQVLRISSLTQELERTHFQHFVDLKEICTDDQLPAFEKLASELSAYFNRNNQPKHRP